MQSIGDESKIDTEDRRYYQQNYQFQLQGFLLDEEEFEVKPAISRSLVLFGFDEKNRKKEKRNLGESNPDKVRTSVDFSASELIKSITYDYKSNITIQRLNNIASLQFEVTTLKNNYPLTLSVNTSPPIRNARTFGALPLAISVGL